MLRFKSFLLEYDMSSNWKVLGHSDLLKYGGDRLETFFLKIKDGEEFLTTKGLVKINKSEYDTLKMEMPSKGFSKTISTNKGPVKYPKDFYKTPEFGGKGKGAGTAAEDRYLNNFIKELDRVMEEENQPVITLIMGGRKVECAGIISTTQTGRRAPKSDFTIFDSKGTGVAWISHKAGKTGKDFQQYGGLTDPIYNNISDVQKFAADVIKAYPEGLTSGQTFYRSIKDPKVIGISVYGLEYGSKARSKENVDEFHQGNMTLSKRGPGLYEIKSAHKGMNGDIPKGSWEAKYVARYTNNVKYLGIKNARVGIFPNDKIPGTAEEI